MGKMGKVTTSYKAPSDGFIPLLLDIEYFKGEFSFDELLGAW